jgi:hypothetical protein
MEAKQIEKIFLALLLIISIKQKIIINHIHQCHLRSISNCQ